MNLLLSKYRILGKKGEGTFSDVLKCQNIKDGTCVACKKMKQTYERCTAGEWARALFDEAITISCTAGEWARALFDEAITISMDQVKNLREIQAMQRLNPHTNVLDLLEIVFDKKSGTLVLVVELMDMNMYELIKGRKQYLGEPLVKHYLYQLLKSLDHMHRNGIFHRDVKPENILIKEDLLKLADFGSCRSVYSKQPYTEYISTRWYRAPECLLTDGYYTYKMDMWSVGCVFFEILSLHPLFPGSNEVDQIAKIHDIMGTPEPAVLKKMKKSRGISFNFPPKQGTGIERLLPHVSQEAVELINKMCTYDPEDRVTARWAVKQPYFKELRDADRRAAALAQSRHRDEIRKHETIERHHHPKHEGAEEKTKEPEVSDERPSEVVMYPIRAPVKAQSNPAKGRVGSKSYREPQAPKVEVPVESTSDTESNIWAAFKHKRKAYEDRSMKIARKRGLLRTCFQYDLHATTIRRHHNIRRYAGSQQYPNHTGLLPRVTMHHPTYNPTFHSTSMPAYHHFDHPSGGSLLPAINNVNTFKPHKAPSKPSKNMFTYTLPSVDRQ